MALTHYARLVSIAHRAMLERGLQPDFPAGALEQLRRIAGPAAAAPELPDLSALPWCSIDNDDSRDLDQLSVSEAPGENRTRILVAVADVDEVVARGTPIDEHARTNTTSVYTAGGTFPMLPELLSTDLTSLNQAEERVAVVMDYFVEADGTLSAESVYRARVMNQAKLAYDATSAWLEGKAELPPAAARVKGLDAQLRAQDAAAARLRARRHAQGALDLTTIQPRALIEEGQVVGLVADEQNRGRILIEEFMVAANGVTARFLKARKLPSLRRVVRSPERWARIVTYAAQFGEKLPREPDSGALEAFLARRRAADPLRFPDVSLAVVKLMGRGEYVLEVPGEAPIGHFGLAVSDYAHSTAPNRRYPDLVTHRVLKSALSAGQPAYDRIELQRLAAHCSEQEDNANRVERQVRKSAAALFLQDRIGAQFDAVVTGASEKGTWVRALAPPVEGMLVRGAAGAAVGDRLHVKLLSVDVDKGFIDFARA
jgi:exoribonuclease-2